MIAGARPKNKRNTGTRTNPPPNPTIDPKMLTAKPTENSRI